MAARNSTNKHSFLLMNWLKFLEDSRYPSIGPHLRLLSVTGLWHPKPKTKLAKLKMCLFYITITFFFSQYIRCVIKFQMSYLLLILQYAPFHLGIVKSCYFQKDYKKWENIINYLSKVERTQIIAGDERVNEILNEYISRSRRVSYFFWSLAFFSNFSIFSEPYQNNRSDPNGTTIYLKIFDGYTPYSDEPPGYYISMFIQTVLGHIISAYVVCWDTLITTMMIFFAAQLRITRLMCTRIIDIENAENCHRNIADCHQFYIKLLQQHKLFNDLISPAMFVYLIVISVNLGVCIIQISQLKDDLATLLSSCLFMVACLIQLLLFYWHSNEITEASVLVSYGTFESDWIATENKYQREVLLLGRTTKKILVLKAGNFNEMSLKTFIAILRASYSFYTLLSETNKF